MFVFEHDAFPADDFENHQIKEAGASAATSLVIGALASLQARRQAWLQARPQAFN